MSLWRRSKTRSFSGAILPGVIAAAIAVCGCGVKRTVQVRVPQAILAAKVATLDDVLATLAANASKVTTLSSTSAKITFTAGRLEAGKVQEYRGAPGYILLGRPDRIRLSIQFPLTRTAILELASAGDDFSIWYPRENKFFIGKNSARAFDLEGGAENPAFSARPIHIYEAILPQAIDVPQAGLRIAMREEQDADAKYYVVSLFQDAAPSRLSPVRDLWIERSTMNVVRQVTYEPDGAVASKIWYRRLSTDSVPLPLSMRIERPADGYSIDLEVKEWKLNPSFDNNPFQLSAPAGARQIVLKEKQRSGDR